MMFDDVWTKQVNAQNEEGDTPLHTAAEEGDLKATQILLASKPSHFVKNNDGYKASVVAVMYEHHEIAELLEPDVERLDSAKNFAHSLLEEEEDLYASADEIVSASPSVDVLAAINRHCLSVSLYAMFECKEYKEHNVYCMDKQRDQRPNAHSASERYRG